MELKERFDAVVMLTWSHWEHEPRSNRYHYATRFGKELPVLFVEPWGEAGSPIGVRSTCSEGVEVWGIPAIVDQPAVEAFLAKLRERNIRRPLIWVYNTVAYTQLIEALPSAFRVLHATEDYLTDSKGWDDYTAMLRESVVRMLQNVDLVVAVSEGVLDSIRDKGRYFGPSALVENGCDAEFFISIAESQPQSTDTNARPVAIFQGGINRRLDYRMLVALATLLPGWDFWFCGGANETLDGWQDLLECKNVKHLGKLEPEAFGRCMAQATVGIIPFIQDDWIRKSLPLKAYEYVACGLPVVTVPIDALESDQAFFSFATTSFGFAKALLRLQSTRHDARLLAERKRIARENSYDARYRVVVDAVLAETQRFDAKPPAPLNVAVLYDDGSCHVSTVRESLDAWRKYSRHSIYYVPATTGVFGARGVSDAVDLSIYDVLILHFSVRISVAHHLAEDLIDQIANHSGLKIAFIQDEYDAPEMARTWLERLDIDVVYTCVPPGGVEHVYPKSRFPRVDFIHTITGSVPENAAIDDFARPPGEREVLIGYRGRRLPHIYGMLGFEKYSIGVDMRRICKARGLPVDIEVDDDQRIYGTDWYRFLGSVRATLGTESGSNVFDFDGALGKAIATLLETEPDMSFQEVHSRILAEHEDLVRMNQISPKVFEAIRLRTALVLFEGKYSGVVEPDVHYISLKKDFSNIDDVLAKVQDDAFVKRMTDRAYDDIIVSGRYSYRALIAGFDGDIDLRVRRGPRFKLYASPTVAIGPFGNARLTAPEGVMAALVSNRMLLGTVPRDGVVELLVTRQAEPLVDTGPVVDDIAEVDEPQLTVPAAIEPPVSAGRLHIRIARRAWRMIPGRPRRAAFRLANAALMRVRRAKADPYGFRAQVFQALWRVRPKFVRRVFFKFARLVLVRPAGRNP